MAARANDATGQDHAHQRSRRAYYRRREVFGRLLDHAERWSGRPGRHPARRMDELVRLGCIYIQVDSPQYPLLDPNIREGYGKRGNDPDQLLELSIELDNAVIGDHPGVTFGLHLCRGNNQSKFYAAW